MNCLSRLSNNHQEKFDRIYVQKKFSVFMNNASAFAKSNSTSSSSTKRYQIKNRKKIISKNINFDVFYVVQHAHHPLRNFKVQLKLIVSDVIHRKSVQNFERTCF